jgi:3-isopropylmalate/(R)-2-methylmalate dehydratase large subunit
MAVEFGAMTGIISPDKKTIDYISGKAFAPKEEEQKLAEDYWAKLKSDDDAHFSKVIEIDASNLSTYVTWGTSPEHAIEIKGLVPTVDQSNSSKENESIKRALDYMGLKENDEIKGTKIDAAFIGSCTNSRLSDLRIAASILEGEKIAPGIKAICVPGSSKVKKDAESEGIDKIFKSAGFEWRESGCSMCFFAGGESFGKNERVISTTNRNFENRQGKKTRTHLASPATVAASAIKGEITAVDQIEKKI